jgi:hypothetical protein
MFQRVVYFWALAAVLATAAVRSVRDVRTASLGLGTTADALWQLAYLVVTLALAAVILRTILRQRPADEPGTGTQAASRHGSAPERSSSPDRSLMGRLYQVRALIRTSFERRPMYTVISMTATLLIVACLPLGLLASRHLGGLQAFFGTPEWILLGLAEVPLAFVAVVVLGGFGGRPIH